MMTLRTVRNAYQPPISAQQAPQPPQVSRPGSKLESTRSSGDSALSKTYAAALATTRGSADDKQITVSPIPANATFGQWWAQFGRAFESPDLVQWMNEKGIDPDSAKINPALGSLTYSLKNDSRSPREIHLIGQDDTQWASVSGPLLAAGRLITAGLGFAILKPPRSTQCQSAPLWLVAAFYKERNANPVLPDHARAAELAAGKGFDVIDDPVFSTLRESRSEEELSSQKAVLGNIHTRHTVALSLKSLLNRPDMGADAIAGALTSTRVRIHPDSSRAATAEAAQTISLKQFIEDNRWNLPSDQAQLENLVNALLRPPIQRPEHANLGGALTWSPPLGQASVEQLRADLRYGKFGDIDVSSFKNVLEYLLSNTSHEASAWKNPAALITLLINSPKGQALGKAIQAKFDARSIKGTATDWLLAAISINAQSPDKGGRRTMAGFVLPNVQDFGNSPADFSLILANLLLDSGQASSFEKAQLLAYVVHATQAPEMMVKNVPKSVTFGSHSWVSFVTAVARIEAKAPGATAGMSYTQVMLEADIKPISLPEQQIEYLAQERALTDWAVANGKSYPSSATQMERVRRDFDDMIEDLKQAAQTRSAPKPTAEDMAMQTLITTFPELTPALLKKRCVYLDPPVRGLHGHYSILDLYRDGRYLEGTPSESSTQFDRNPQPSRWASKSDEIDLDDVIFKLQELPNLQMAFNKRFDTYVTQMSKSIETQFKYLVSKLPEDDRKNFEYGKCTIVKEIKYIYHNKERHVAPRTEPLSTDNSLLIKTLLDGKARTYEINLAKNTITERMEYGDFVPGNFPVHSDRPPLYLKEIKDPNVVDGYLDEKKRPWATPDSYESGRIRTLAQTVAWHANIEALRSGAKGVTSIDSTQAYENKLRQFYLNLIPLRSAIKNFSDGKIGEGLTDLCLDIFGFVVGMGAAAKAAKAAHGLSTLAKVGRGVKIIGTAAVNSLNPLGGIDDLARGLFNGARRGVPSLYNKVRGVLSNVDTAALLKKPSIAQGTLKGANAGDDIIAKFDDATGQWHALDVKTRKPYGEPLAGFQPNTVSVEELSKKAQVLFETQGRPFQVCYHNALLIGQADNAFSARTRATLLDNLKGQPSNYTPRYKELMNVSPATTHTVFDPSTIQESGVINFISKHENGAMVHTAYLQKTQSNQLFIYNKNQAALDHELLKATGSFEVSSGATVFNLNNAGLQNFLNTGYEYTFTPNSIINANVQPLAG